MFWNLAFGVYESLITLPEELTLAADAVRPARLAALEPPDPAGGGAEPPLQLDPVLGQRLVLPDRQRDHRGRPGPLHAARARQLPGARRSRVGRRPQMLLALAVLVVTTVAMHLLVWGPLETWAERFHLDESGDRPRTPRIGRVLARSRIVRWVARELVIVPARPAGAGARPVGVLDSWTCRARWRPLLLGAGHAARALAVAGGAACYVLFAARPLSPRAARTSRSTSLSSFAARERRRGLLGRALAVPLAYVVSRATRGPRWRALAVLQILGSIPATAFFPLIAVPLHLGPGHERGRRAPGRSPPCSAT